VRAALLLLPLIAACASAPVAAPVAPTVDYHQHLVSVPFSPIVKLPPRDAKALLTALDSAGIRRAVVLSVGYSFADERKKLDDPTGSRARRMTGPRHRW
jgi:hypothetical protein